MRAVLQEGYGASDVLRVGDRPAPRPRADEVVIAVRAAGVHAGDVRIMRGEPLMIRAFFGWRRPKNPVAGREVVGTVSAIGEGVQGFALGDRVFAETNQGGFAELVAVAAGFVRPAPANLDDEQVAVMPVSGITALQGWRAGRLQAGDSVLVIGASGGVGTFAVQLAAAKGATVTAVGSAAKADHMRDSGASRVLDYRSDDLMAGSPRYDVIFDLVGDTSLRALRRILAPRGSLVLSAGDGSRVFGPIGRIVTALVQSMLTRQRLVPLAAQRDGDDLEQLRQLAEAGSLRPVVDRVFALDEAPQAFEYHESGAVKGKIALRVA